MKIKPRDLKHLSHLFHDMNQPLIVARVSLEGIRKSVRDKKLVRLSDLGLESVKRSQNMLRYFIDTKSFPTRRSLKLETFRLCDVARALIDSYITIYGNRFRLMDEFIEVHWDRDAFTRTLDNLITNALKYSPKNSVITTSFEITAKVINIEVHNDGSYISPEEKKRIFRPFTKGESGKGKEGWGLGLAIVRETVESLGGTVKIKSARASGTTFIVSLPRKFIS